MVRKMAQLISRTKIINFMLLVLTCFVVSFFICEKAYSAPATPSNLTSDLTESELEEIQEFQDLQEMVGQIFEINTDTCILG